MEMSTTMLLVTPSTESFSLWIPPEIISLILTMLWEVLQTRQERWAFKNFALVSRTWLPLVAFVMSRDAHISGNRSACAFLRLLPERAPAVTGGIVNLFTREAHQVARHVCRSLTFHVDRITWPYCYDNDPTANVLHAATKTHSRSLANLRHISIRYTDRAYDHILAHITQGLFPPQVTRLSLAFPFTAAAPAEFPFPPFTQARRPEMLKFAHEVAPNVRHLALSNVPPTFVAAVLGLCPNTETLELTNPGSLARLPVPVLGAPLLPPSVRTLVLRHPGAALSKKTMGAWGLRRALEEGLVARDANRHAKPPRIVVRAGTPDPATFVDLSRWCKRFGTELVYERGRDRDDAPPPPSHSGATRIRIRVVSSCPCKIRIGGRIM